MYKGKDSANVAYVCYISVEQIDPFIVSLQNFCLSALPRPPPSRIPVCLSCKSSKLFHLPEHLSAPLHDINLSSPPA